MQLQQYSLRLCCSVAIVPVQKFNITFYSANQVKVSMSKLVV